MRNIYKPDTTPTFGPSAALVHLLFVDRKVAS